jgi:hypothetical protein
MAVSGYTRNKRREQRGKFERKGRKRKDIRKMQSKICASREMYPAHRESILACPSKRKIFL